MGSHRIVAAAVVGKMNEPLYFYTEEDTAEALNLQMIVYGSLDVVEEKRRKPSNTVPSVDSAYLGALYSTDDYKVYGHYSNTQIKTILVCDHSLLEITARSAILELSEQYVTAMQNPFQAIGMPIISKKFTEHVQKVLLRSQSSQSSQQTPKKM